MSQLRHSQVLYLLFQRKDQLQLSTNLSTKYALILPSKQFITEKKSQNINRKVSPKLYEDKSISYMNSSCIYNNN